MAAQLTPTTHRYTATLGRDQIIIETGKLAEQAGGAVTVRLADTMVFATATMSKHPREGIDFFPLSVDFEEKMYAAGRIPGSFFRREGRPSESAILSSRVTDRTLRPLFPKDMRNDVQVILTAFSHDQEHPIDMLGIIGASAALMISDIPWNGPVCGVRIGLIDGELVINPTHSEMENSALDLRVSGTADAINMVECGATEVDEATMLKALRLAHDSIQPVLATLNQMRADLGKPKVEEYSSSKISDELVTEVAARVRDRVRQIVAEQTMRDERNEAFEALRAELTGEYEARNANITDPAQIIKLGDVREAMSKVIREEVRRRILHDKVRPDGRDYVTIRPLSAEVSLIPRVHGSGLFKRGQTQVLTVATLGTPRDSQSIDGLSPEDTKRYLHHYNFPPYSTGEVRMLRSTGRREIGHGALAETALRSMIPPEDEFPYTIRLVSEVLSSNGSTSMASVCGSTLALMDAGVPIKAPVAGIAMGLIKEGDAVAVLTDIQGMEDHLGDMDFKVAGTADGITALQMDIKIAGVTDAVMAQALEQARVARLEILETMRAVIATPRPDLSDYAPRITIIKIDPEKIGAVIGPGGKVIRGIQERTGVKIDIEEDGTVFIAASDGPAAALALEQVRALTEDAEIGRVYTGKVVRIESYGAFVEFLPGKEGMVHISQLADYRVNSVEDEVSLGDEIMVMVTDVDPQGKVRLSRQAVLEGWTAEEARQRDSRGRSGGGRPGGGDRGGRGGDRDRRGGGDRGRH
ncbi:MAG: polyribonucleotide nucleotidyltransferase [Chloroflexota bacterium]|nr:MAG: polyribonucleotide nucleotidyltransferase [Chloroflexota bacterium]